MPVAVQVASLLADGVLYYNTEKSLTDHGLSMVVNQDCAVWRALKGSDICSDYQVEQTVLASLEGDVALPKEQPVKPAAVMVKSAPPVKSAPSVEKIIPTLPVVSSVSEPSFIEERSLQVAALEVSDPVDPVRVSRKITPRPANHIAVQPALSSFTKPGTYLVISSYLGPTYAMRQVRRQAAYNPTILTGSVEGNTVYRVAVGPISDRGQKSLRKRLSKAGFKGVWPVQVEPQQGVVEVASLN